MSEISYINISTTPTFISTISYINISTTPTFISTCLKSLTSIYLQLLPLFTCLSTSIYMSLLHQYIYNSYIYNSYLYIYMSEISYMSEIHQYIYNSYLYIYMSEISYINISTTPTFISTCLKSLTSIYLQLLPLYLHV